MANEGENSKPAAGTFILMKCIKYEVPAALTSAQKGLIVSIRAVPPELIGDQQRQDVAELFPSATLFQEEICDLTCAGVIEKIYQEVQTLHKTRHDVSLLPWPMTCTMKRKTMFL